MNTENKLDKLIGLESDLEKERGNPIEYYQNPASVRHLDFVQPSGEREFISYTLLTNCQINDEKTTIELFYSNGQHVILNGRNLDDLYLKLFYYLPKQITAIDKRYSETMDNKEVVIFEIVITKP